jgi:signal transduction histidine kinase
LAQRTVRDARRVIADLRPTELDDLGLAAAIRLQLEPLRSEGWRADLEENLGGERLPPMVETVLLRVVQEALRNARKHAHADAVSVELVRGAASVRLQVRDCGKGFRPDQLTVGSGPGERVGIEGMLERVHLLGGSLEIRSAPGVGTTVIAHVPLVWEGEADG